VYHADAGDSFRRRVRVPPGTVRPGNQGLDDGARATLAGVEETPDSLDSFPNPMPDTTDRTLTREDGGAGEFARRATTCPALFLCLSCDKPVIGGARYFLHGTDEVVLRRDAGLTADRRERTLVVGIPDRRVSSLHARINRSAGTWIISDAGSKNGVLVDGARVERAVLTDHCLLEIGHTLLLFRSAVRLASDSDHGTLSAPADDGTATLIPSLEEQFVRARQFAETALPVALLGETGTGKELLARAIHHASGRLGPFVGINCGALPASIIESELFGHRKGAFSGATEDRPGLVRAADKGTLFLDEIGDLPLPLQVRFLRVLQEHEVTPLGATRPVAVDLRVVSATHRNLEAMVEQGDLRADLFARLSGTTIRLPPLRDRREDIGLLVGSILPKVSRNAASLQISVGAGRALLAYRWPHNIRELERCLEAACAVAKHGTIEEEDLPDAVRGRAPRTSVSDEIRAQLTGDDLKTRERLIALLEEHGGNLSAVARQMGKGRTQIQRWVKRYKLDR
jgi:sigma-54 dependent transcriptional regulator, acetoin dehydrogenase operon transcriptional activator AcoR